ncbi:MAG: hypothetical protein KJ904_06460 [Alphaproteobacteria bacterium]|nr:hypothetical protein [Alphaproteobacteria bacterium]MBU0798959.1 hypothetical protein [Alphaproteobacteria bacterium]MBU0886789.1 hypothetical protein [Alphaproteobacteria bacterium]MBU1812469.1 hypothetical protein [Alphaproteobacteria bacterium]MBU2092258.1 hypothetical protein [Alphaproteobacteria bacterium]
MKQRRAGSIIRHRWVCWLLSLAFVALLVLGALGSGSRIFAFAIIGPGSILAIVVLMGIRLLGLFPWVEDMLGLEGPSMYMLVSLLMGVVFWWALALALLLYRRRKLITSETASSLRPSVSQ